MKPLSMSIVVPCYNEQEVFAETCKRLLQMMTRLQVQGNASKHSQITFVDDGSVDNTWALIEAAALQDSRVNGIKLSKNCGHQCALLAGLLNATGEIVISLDADLQDDIEAIPQMIAAYRNGAEIVYGIRSSRETDSRFKRWSARTFYKVLARLGVDIVADHADFRLMSSKAIKNLASFKEVNLFLRGIVPLLGYKTAKVTYDRHSRYAGESKYPFLKMLKLAFDGIFSLSTVPLQWISILGGVLAIFSVMLGLWAIALKLFTNATIPGWASSVVPMYFLGGLQLLALGIIGGYLSRVYSETKQRPRFFIEKQAGSSLIDDAVSSTSTPFALDEINQLYEQKSTSKPLNHPTI